VHPLDDAAGNTALTRGVVSTVTKTSLILPVLAAAALIAGCGGGGYGENSTQPTAAKGAETATIPA
jgi:hypothetical protein